MVFHPSCLCDRDSTVKKPQKQQQQQKTHDRSRVAAVLSVPAASLILLLERRGHAAPALDTEEAVRATRASWDTCRRCVQQVSLY